MVYGLVVYSCIRKDRRLFSYLECRLDKSGGNIGFWNYFFGEVRRGCIC